MTSMVSNVIFKRILQETVQNSQGRDDPYFEMVPARNLVSISGKGGKRKMKRQKKRVPPGLSRKDERTLNKVKRRAYRMDMALGTICGIKIGWGSIIGIVPGFGDVIDAFLALMVIRTACEAEIPDQLRMRMFLNVIFDFAIGLIPFAGDLADMWYKANTRNAILLEDFLRKRGAKNLREQGITNEPDYSLEDAITGRVEEEVVSTPPAVQQQPAYASNDSNYDVEAQRKNKKAKWWKIGGRKKSAGTSVANSGAGGVMSGGAGASATNGASAPRAAPGLERSRTGPLQTGTT